MKRDTLIYAVISLAWSGFVFWCMRSTISREAGTFDLTCIGPGLLSFVLMSLIFRSTIRDAKPWKTLYVSLSMLGASFLFAVPTIGVWSVLVTFFNGKWGDAPDLLSAEAVVRVVAVAIFAAIPTFQALKMADNWALDREREVLHA